MFRGHTLDLYPVLLQLAVFRMGNTLLQSAVVGENQQAFAVVIQSAGGVDIIDINIIRQGLFIAFSREL